MNPFRLLLCPALLTMMLSANAQINAGMPPAKDLVTQFFYSYMEPDNFSSYYFQKKAEGWYVRMLDNSGAYSQPQLYWSKEQHRYLVLDFALQNHPDSETVAGLFAEYARRYLLTAEDIIRYDRNLYFGYDGWDQDVIRTFEMTPPATDSLWETLSNAYDQAAGACLLPGSYRKMGYSKPNIEGFISCENKAIAALRHIRSSNPHYQAAFHDITGQLNTILMATTTTLKLLGVDSLANPFIQATAFPGPVLQKYRQILYRLPPNSILFTDSDTTTFPIAYLQAKGERPDIVQFDNLFMVLQESIARLHQKALASIQPATYQDSAFSAALYQTDEHDTATHSLDTVLAALYASPDAPERPHLDPAVGRLYRYFTSHPYLINKKGDRVKIDLPEKYMTIFDVLELDIVNSNYRSRHIFYTHPHLHPIVEPFCHRISPGLYEFIPNPLPASGKSSKA